MTHNKAIYDPSAVSTLIISRGAKLKSIGLQDSPIIFTTEYDDIRPNELKSTLSVPFFEPGFWSIYSLKENPLIKSPEGWWGGLVLLGDAPGSYPDDRSESIYDGNPNLVYGGNGIEGNSGILKYVSIRYAGMKPAFGKPYSALTLAGLGSRTILENIEIQASAGHGVSILGGSTSIKNLISEEISGVGVRIAEGWSETLDNFLVIYVREQVFDVAGPTASRFKGNHQIKNGSVLAFPSKGLVSLSQNANTELSHVFFYEISEYLQKGIDQISNGYQCKVERIEFHIPNVLKYYEGWGWDEETSYYPQLIFDRYFSMWDSNLVKQTGLRYFSVGPKLAPFENWSTIMRPYQVANSYPPGF